MKKTNNVTLSFSPDDMCRINDTIQRMIDRFPIEIPTLEVSEYAERERVLPLGTPYPGRWSNTLTPYAVEIIDNLSARSEIQETIWIKAAQVGATASVENFLAYVISTVPGPTLYCSAKEEMLRKWVNKRFNPLIKSCNLEDKIFKQHALKAGRATGNQMFSKEFPGGSLDLVSAQSESNLRMDSIRYLILDEAGAYPWSIAGFGDPIEIARARTANWGSRKKIFIPSTPGLEGECRMWPLFQQGDQRRYCVLCPLCKKQIVLKFPSEPDDFYEGTPASLLQWETVAGVLDKSSVHVKCAHCGGRIPDRLQFDLIQTGRWVPFAEPRKELTRSYQLGRLYSLMDKWARLAQEEIEAQGDETKLQAHHNLNCGIPYRGVTQKPDIKNIYELRGNYVSSEIPTDKVLFLTAAVDVQAGKKHDPDSPARLEMEVCGHGFGYRTWSLQYKVFVGAVTDPYSGAWQAFYDYMSADGMACRRSDGFIMRPQLIFIDSGDGNTETMVFDFCERLQGAVPIKGVHDLEKSAAGKRADIVLDERGPRDRDRFREHTKYDQIYVSIYTTWYKNRFWSALKLPRQATGEQRPRFCEFPRDYPDKYFDMLVAEEKKADGSFWRPISKPNESLDLRIYNMAACDYWLYLATQAKKKMMVRGGFTREEADCTRSKHILDELARAVKRK